MVCGLGGFFFVAKCVSSTSCGNVPCGVQGKNRSGLESEKRASNLHSAVTETVGNPCSTAVYVGRHRTVAGDSERLQFKSSP